ncbi:hypothetical protein ACJJTC_004485 [Scirpophaga incertulas]
MASVAASVRKYRFHVTTQGLCLIRSEAQGELNLASSNKDALLAALWNESNIVGRIHNNYDLQIPHLNISICYKILTTKQERYVVTLSTGWAVAAVRAPRARQVLLAVGSLGGSSGLIGDDWIVRSDS